MINKLIRYDEISNRKWEYDKYYNLKRGKKYINISALTIPSKYLTNYFTYIMCSIPKLELFDQIPSNSKYSVSSMIDEILINEVAIDTVGMHSGPKVWFNSKDQRFNNEA